MVLNKFLTAKELSFKKYNYSKNDTQITYPFKMHTLF